MKLGIAVKGARPLPDGAIAYESLPAGTELHTRVVRGLTEFVTIFARKDGHEYAIVDVFPDRLDHAITYLTAVR